MDFWNGARAQIDKFPQPWRGIAEAIAVVLILAAVPATRKWAVPAGIVIVVVLAAKFFKQQKG